MRKRSALAIAIVFAIAIIMIIIPSPAVAAPQNEINWNSSSFQSDSSSNPLPLKTIFKQVQNSVVQITSKVPTRPNPSNQSSVTTLGSGFVYDKQGHIVTNGHVVDDGS